MHMPSSDSRPTNAPPSGGRLFGVRWGAWATRAGSSSVRFAAAASASAVTASTSRGSKRLDVVVLAGREHAEQPAARAQRPGQRRGDRRAHLPGATGARRSRRRATSGSSPASSSGASAPGVRRHGEAVLAVADVQHGAGRAEQRVEARDQRALEQGAVGQRPELVAPARRAPSRCRRVLREKRASSRVATWRSPIANAAATTPMMSRPTSKRVDRAGTRNSR